MKLFGVQWPWPTGGRGVRATTQRKTKMDEDEFNIEALTKQRKAKEDRQKAEAVKAAGGDAELEAILLQTQQVKKETLDSTQRSVKMLNETISVADRTNEKLTAQGEQLDRIAATSERADANANESYQHAKDLHKFKGFLPVSLSNAFKGKDKKEQDRQLDEARKQHESAKSARSPTDTSPPGQAASGPKKAQYADETEQQINDNLDDISAGLAHLKTSGLTMQQKMKEQEATMTYIEKTTAHTDYTIGSAGRKIKEFE